MLVFKKVTTLAAKIAPRVEIFGLEISDGLVRFYALGKGSSQARDYPLRLPPGVVEKGKVVNKEVLIKALSELRKKVAKSTRRKLSVILTIPISNVYLQPFVLPVVAESSLAESAELNMRMISPIDVDTAYLDWQKVKSDNNDQVTVIGGFAAQELVDEFISSVQEANFGVAAVEFSSLSLVRAAHSIGLAEVSKPQFILEISQAGLEFAVSHLGSLYFHYFSPWDYYREGKIINADKLKEGLVNETRKVLNFYSTSFKTSEVKNMILVGQDYIGEITQAIQSNFPGVEIKTANFGQLNAAMGAALRGQVSRAQDMDISLASFSAIELFRTNELSNFIAIWRNVILTVFGSLLLILLTSVTALQQTAKEVVAQDPFRQAGANAQELVTLIDQANEFNTTVSMLKGIVGTQIELFPLLERITQLKGSRVDLSKVEFHVERMNLSLSGTGVSEGDVIDFKGKLEEDENFEKVELPLSELKTLIDGSAQFSLRATVKKLDF